MKRIFCWMLLLVPAAFAQGPSQFYVATEAFSDYGPSWYTYILDITPDGNDTLVRYVRIANVDVFCSIATVKLAQVRLRDTTPAKIAAGNNPCAIQPATVRDAVRKFHHLAGTFETASFGIVAQCGSREVVLLLPDEQGLDMKRMKRTFPKVAHLWEFADDLQTRVFGDSNPFDKTPEEKDWQLQEAGKTVVPELMAGRFNKGFDHGKLPNDLSSYRGPIKPPDYAPQLESAETYRFTNYVAPVYPPLAKAARIQGKVELQFTVVPETGEVQDLVTLSGHPLLREGAVDAAKKWRLVPGSTTSEPIHAVLDFALRCP